MSQKLKHYKLITNMVKESIIRALLAGVCFVILTWIGDGYIFNQETSLLVYIIKFIVFTGLMTIVYYFSHKIGNKKKQD